MSVRRTAAIALGAAVLLGPAAAQETPESQGGVVEAASRSLGPSFDCAAAATRVEHMICDDPELSVLDLEMAELYFSRLRRTSGVTRATMQASQRDWRADRDACAEGAGAGQLRACLARSYVRRIAELR